MIDSDLGVLALASGILAFLAVSIAYCFHGALRLKVLGWLAGLLTLFSIAFLGRWYSWHMGFFRLVDDLWPPHLFLFAAVFGLAALGVWIWFIVLHLREP
ncbi:hypothetical protein [Paracoccus sp. N5]|uniref:hypothetical protein n=1 Tax=Paracoccus sp. N5 TaxID=1101189 RepID=UPI0012F92BED|nr:hypothetical protein [Paracoccus sp. N5]